MKFTQQILVALSMENKCPGGTHARSFPPFYFEIIIHIIAIIALVRAKSSFAETVIGVMGKIVKYAFRCLEIERTR